MGSMILPAPSAERTLTCRAVLFDMDDTLFDHHYSSECGLAALHDEMTREVGRVNALLDVWQGWRAERKGERGLPARVRVPGTEGG